MPPVKSLDRVGSLQEKLRSAAKADRRRRFHSLWDKVCSMYFLVHGWERVRENRGAAGVDGVTIEMVEEQGVEVFLTQLQEDLQGGRYVPLPVRRVMIPKPGGGERPLGIPAVRDRVVQSAVKALLEPIFEVDFLPASRGFRPGMSAVDAARAVQVWLTLGLENVLDADIRKCFDEIPHDQLMQRVARRVSDGRILQVVRAWLAAPIVTRGLVLPSRRGTPQGGVLSPLLANIHLHSFDQWAMEGDRQSRSPSVPQLVRYADDFVVLARRSVRYLSGQVKRHLSGMGLVLHEEKTRVVRAKQGFNFLGYRFVRRPHQGRYVNLVFPSPGAVAHAREQIREHLGRNKLHMQPEKVVQDLNRYLVGWIGYYGHFQSRRTLAKLQTYVNNRLRRFLRRRKGQAGIGRNRDLPNDLLHEEYGLVRLETLRRKLADSAADSRAPDRESSGRRAV